MQGRLLRPALIIKVSLNLLNCRLTLGELDEVHRVRVAHSEVVSPILLVHKVHERKAAARENDFLSPRVDRFLTGIQFHPGFE